MLFVNDSGRDIYLPTIPIIYHLYFNASGDAIYHALIDGDADNSNGWRELHFKFNDVLKKAISVANIGNLQVYLYGSIELYDSNGLVNPNTLGFTAADKSFFKDILNYSIDIVSIPK